MGRVWVRWSGPGLSPLEKATSPDYYLHYRSWSHSQQDNIKSTLGDSRILMICRGYTGLPWARTTPISPSFNATKLLVYFEKALVSDAMKVLPWPNPITMGEPLQATTISSGLFLLMTANPQLPSQLRSVERGITIAQDMKIVSKSLTGTEP